MDPDQTPEKLFHGCFSPSYHNLPEIPQKERDFTNYNNGSVIILFLSNK